MFGAFARKGKGKSGAHVAPVDFDGECGVACLCEALRSSSTHECVRASAAAAVAKMRTDRPTDPTCEYQLVLSSGLRLTYSYPAAGMPCPPRKHYSRTGTAQTEPLHRRTALRCNHYPLRWTALRQRGFSCRIYPPT
jgi:hypothetical protein